MQTDRPNADHTPVTDDLPAVPNKTGVYRFTGERRTHANRIVTADAIVCIRHEYVKRQLALVVFFFGKQTRFPIDYFQGRWLYICPEPKEKR